MNQFNVLTLFPDVFSCFVRESIVGRSCNRGIIGIYTIDIRTFSRDKHRKVDDYPFGGGRGMLLTPDPLFRALESIEHRGRVIYLTPMGRVYTQAVVKELAKEETITLICGHYEGIDHRVVEKFVDEELSIGDYILTGGEIAAAAVIDSITRELDDSLGNRESALEETFDATGLLEFEQYTRPADYRGMRVPDVLLSGHHAEIEKWKIKRRLVNTLKRRAELLAKVDLPDMYKKILQEIKEERDNERC